MEKRKDLTGYPEIEIRILDGGPDIIDVCKIDGWEIPGLRKIEITAPFDNIPIVKFEILGRINLKMKSKVHVLETITFDDQAKKAKVPQPESEKDITFEDLKKLIRGIVKQVIKEDYFTKGSEKGING